MERGCAHEGRKPIRKEMNDAPNDRPDKCGFGSAAFTLVELLVVMAIIALLATLTTGMVRQALESARRSACMSVIRNIGVASRMYAQEHRFVLPRLEWFEQDLQLELLRPYLGGDEAHHCPGAIPENRGLAWPEVYARTVDGRVEYTDYKLNDNVQSVAGKSMDTLPHPEWVVLAIDIEWGPFRHGTGENMVFLDGRAAWYSREDAQGEDGYGNWPWYKWGTK